MESLDTSYLYSSEKARLLLEHPYDSDKVIMNPNEGAFFAATLTASNRISVSKEPESQYYHNSWYFQGSEATCAPWAVVNAIHALGVSLDPNFVANILNHKLLQVGLAGGFSPEVAKKYLADSKMSVEIAKLSDPTLNLIEIPEELQVSKIPKVVRDFFDPSLRFKRETYSQSLSKLRQNAGIIEKTIDSQKMLMITVDFERYADIPEETGFHTIVLSGFRVNENLSMDVQVIDSDRGLVWMSLEHFSQSLVGPIAHEVRRS